MFTRAVKVEKHFCPLDQNALIVVNSTPAFARMVSWKYENMAAPQVEIDLLKIIVVPVVVPRLRICLMSLPALLRRKKGTGATRFLIYQTLQLLFRWDWMAQHYSTEMVSIKRLCMASFLC